MPEHTVVPARVRLLAALMVIALVAVSYAIWTSPLARRTAGQILAAPLPGDGLTAPSDALRPAQPQQVSRARRTGTDEVAKLRADLAALQRRVGRAEAARGSGERRPATAESRPLPSTPHRPRPKRCWDFRWQQDAQAAYLADLADPQGLDGAPGPNNDDGIACAELPVDPRRPKSAPAGARVLPTPVTPSVSVLRQPKQNYFGLYTDQSPYSWSEVDRVAQAVGKVPNLAGFFGAGDTPFRADAALAAWRRGMLPLLTWELRPAADMGPGGAEALRPGYALAEIAGGSLDGYLQTYARAVAKFGLPIAIRLNHEMNGSWYPWTVYNSVNGRDGKTGAEWYQLMWRHVHDIFTKAGAGNVIWVWSPNRVTFARSDFRNFYPGDAYVDWIGLSGYYRYTSEPATFAGTYGPTLGKLRDQVGFPHAAKPILLSEIGATETGGNKVVWLNDLFAALRLPDNADIIGFAWFHSVVTSGSSEAGRTTNDWRITSSETAAAAFAAGVADPVFGSGH